MLKEDLMAEGSFIEQATGLEEDFSNLNLGNEDEAGSNRSEEDFSHLNLGNEAGSDRLIQTPNRNIPQLEPKRRVIECDSGGEDTCDCLYAWVTPFQCTGDYAMKIVKVGATINPGERLRDEWIAMNAVTRLQHMTLSDDIKKDQKIEDVIKSAKNHDKVLFIVCIKIPDRLSKEENRTRAELGLRGVMGRPIGGPFLDQFMCELEKLKKRDKFRKSGWTEWIICKEDTVNAIQVDFRKGHLDGKDTVQTQSTPPEGETNVTHSKDLQPQPQPCLQLQNHHRVPLGYMHGITGITLSRELYNW